MLEIIWRESRQVRDATSVGIMKKVPAIIIETDHAVRVKHIV